MNIASAKITVSHSIAINITGSNWWYLGRFPGPGRLGPSRVDVELQRHGHGQETGDVMMATGLAAGDQWRCSLTQHKSLAR